VPRPYNPLPSNTSSRESYAPSTGVAGLLSVDSAIVAAAATYCNHHIELADM
jgi:hypothetical protein